MIVGGASTIDLKAAFEVEGQGGKVGGANLQVGGPGPTFSGGVQSMLEKVAGEALLAPVRVGRQVVDVQFIENERGGEESEDPGGIVARLTNESDEGEKAGVGEKKMVPIDPTGAQATAEFERHHLRDQRGGEEFDADQ